MSTCKKYYWLKLPKDFFLNPKIKKLRKIAGGDTYTIIYQKLMLLTLKTDGILEYENIEDTFIDELALILDEDIDNVKVTISYLLRQGLLEQLDNTSYLMSEVPKFIGSETTSAERVRRHRNKVSLDHNKPNESKKALQCNTDVTKSNTELELELELEKELEIKKKKINKKEFNFSLSKQVQYSNLSEEYKTKLKAKCLLADGDIIRYEDFILQLEAKGYKYKNFYLAYLSWDKEKLYKRFKPKKEPRLGDDWYVIKISEDKVLAINSKTLKIVDGEAVRDKAIEEKPIQTFKRDMGGLTKCITRI